MEEHFRKSLGADYSKLFKEKPEKAEKEEEEKMEVDPVKAFKEDLHMSGNTGIASFSCTLFPFCSFVFLSLLFFSGGPLCQSPWRDVDETAGEGGGEEGEEELAKQLATQCSQRIQIPTVGPLDCDGEG